MKARRRLESSRNAIYGKDGPPADNKLLVSKKQAASLLQISTRKIDDLKRLGQIPQPIRIGRAIRWNRAELAGWVDAGCPDCNTWKRGEASSLSDHASIVRKRSKKGQAPTKTKTRNGSGKKKNKPKETSVDAEGMREWQPPFNGLAISIGLDNDKLPNFTNGQLMEIAELDLVTYHNWNYKGGELPEPNLKLMKAKLLSQFPLLEYGLDSTSQQLKGEGSLAIAKCEIKASDV